MDEMNELLVAVYDPTDREDSHQPRGKQALRPSGITYSRTTGIWQPVWMEPTPNVHAASFSLVPCIETHSVGVSISFGASHEVPRHNHERAHTQEDEACARACG